jgi:hypothetical protein
MFATARNRGLTRRIIAGGRAIASYRLLGFVVPDLIRDRWHVPRKAR